MEMKSSFVQLCMDAAHGVWWLFLNLDVFESKGRLLEFVTRNIVKADKSSEVKEQTCTKSCAFYLLTNAGYSRLFTWISRLINFIVD